MARSSMMARLMALAMMLPTAAPAQTADEPSFFDSLWSSIKGAVDRGAPDSKDTPAVRPAVQGVPASAAEPPSLSRARWIGFTPVIVGSEGEGEGEGAWIAGPFVEAGATAWVTDTVSGLTVEVRLVWREATAGSLAELSAKAGKRLGLAPGAVANVTIYLAR
jgi:hypothetical protein